MSAKLTKAQAKRLAHIAAYVPSTKWPHAAFWGSSRTDKSLVDRGLVERIEYASPGSGIFAVTLHLCRLTDAGRAILAAGDA